ncbi:hypothetical protein [Moorena sp. SIO4G3]|nr:hypothetical protein [Moorena sp. SIO4G3]
MPTNLFPIPCSQIRCSQIRCSQIRCSLKNHNYVLNKVANRYKCT